jgi:hypothetical protein
MEKDVYQQVDFLEEHDGSPRLKRSHKYYTQVQAQMWVCGVSHSFFVVWTFGHRPLYEEIKLDSDFINMVINNLTIFYKAYIIPCILGYRDILQCPKCEKVILEGDEINCTATENSICCDICNTWWHLQCAGLTEVCVESLDTWLCFSCLIDNAGPGDDDSSGEETGKNDPAASTSTGKMNSVCPVCSLKDIPVGGEHICSICKSAVHAWCSNHEDITSSLDLVCNYCLD